MGIRAKSRSNFLTNETNTIDVSKRNRIKKKTQQTEITVLIKMFFQRTFQIE